MTPQHAEIILQTAHFKVILDNKEYEIIVTEEGIFIRGNEPLKILNQSSTGLWLVLK